MNSVAARRCLFVILGGALAVRGWHLAAFAHDAAFRLHENAPQTDNAIFYEWAKNIVQGDWLGRTVYHPIESWQLGLAPAAQWEAWYGTAPTFFKAPLYAYLIALLKLGFAQPILPLVLLQFAASLVSVLLLFLIGRRLFGEGAGLIAAALYGLFAPAIHYDVSMLRGPWIVLTGLLVTWQLVHFLERPTLARSLAIGVVAGVGILFNEAFGMWMFFIPLAMAASRVSPSGFKPYAMFLGAFFGGALLVMAPVFLRNVLVGAPVLKIAATGGMLAVHNAPEASPYFFHPRGVARFIEAGHGGFFATFWACLRGFRSPVDVLALYFERFVGILAPFENADNFNFYYGTLRSPLLRWLPDFTWIGPLGLVGAVLAARVSRRCAALGPFFVSTLVALMITAPLSRYRATLVPAFCLFAGLAVVTGARWVRERSWRPVGLAVLSVLTLYLVLGVYQRRVIFNGRSDAPWRYRFLEFSVNAEEQAKARDFQRASATLVEFAQLNGEAGPASSSLLKAAGYQLEAGQPQAARALAERSVLVADHQADLLYASGEFYRTQLQDRPTARALYERAMALHPSPRVKARLELFLQH